MELVLTSRNVGLMIILFHLLSLSKRGWSECDSPREGGSWENIIFSTCPKDLWKYERFKIKAQACSIKTERRNQRKGGQGERVMSESGKQATGNARTSPMCSVASCDLRTHPSVTPHMHFVYSGSWEMNRPFLLKSLSNVLFNSASFQKIWKNGIKQSLLVSHHRFLFSISRKKVMFILFSFGGRFILTMQRRNLLLIKHSLTF